MSSDDQMSRNQRRTANARQALAAKFASPEEKSEHYRAMAQKANAGRLVLSGEEAEALVSAYEVLGRIAERARQRLAETEGSDEDV